MKQQPVYTLAKWQVKEGQLKSVLNLLPELAKKSKAEEGNLVYKIYQSVSDSNTLILYEGYIDNNAREAHRESDHFRELVLKQIVPLLEKRSVETLGEILLE